MRVIFLDVDGVLNSERYALRLEQRHRELGHAEPASPKRETTCDCFKLYHQIDRAAIARLNLLVRVTGAKIVVSSTWRKLFDLPELHRIFSEHGLVAELVGATPEGHKEPALLEAYGHPERVFRGYEIDYWLRQHPEVEKFVILDDGSDMAMHKNRLVQTDCDDGLLDEHVELAIRVLGWDGTDPSPFDELPGPLPIVSTRSNANVDARRDFDGFDVDEELRLLRRALADGRWRIAGELAANLDEHLSRGGALPVAWLGPACMQEDADQAARLRDTLEIAATMTVKERRLAAGGHVAVEPETPGSPGSSWGIHCVEEDCVEALVLERTTTIQPSRDDDYQRLEPTLSAASVSLGWRVYRSGSVCPTHVIAKKLVCRRCSMPCPTCACLGGPTADAVDGEESS